MEESKKCSKCNIVKPLIDFHRKTMVKDGRASHCKKCVSKHQKKHYSKPHIRDARIKRQREPEYRLQQRQHHLQKNYGISLEDYDEMLKSQNNACKICKTNKPSGRSDKYFHIDHCHDSGKVRGLLCHRCNMALGILQENLEVLDNLVNYIKSS